LTLSGPDSGFWVSAFPLFSGRRGQILGEWVRETLLLDIPHRQVVFAIPKMLDDSRRAELFAREVLADLVRKELLSPGWTERILSWRHIGFLVHSRVRAKTKLEADASSRWVEGIILITRFAQLAQLKR
jgi:hypothetical protein